MKALFNIAQVIGSSMMAIVATTQLIGACIISDGFRWYMVAFTALVFLSVALVINSIKEMKDERD